MHSLFEAVFFLISAVISKYLKYVASLEFDTKPDYTYCRKLLQKGVLDAGFVDDGKLEFGFCVTPKQKSNKAKKVSEKKVLFFFH